MENSGRVARLTGILVFVQLALLIVPYVILMPGVTTEYLTAAAGMSMTIKTAVFLLFGTAAVTMAIAIMVYPVFREYSQRWTILFLAISVVWFVMQFLDNAYILSMLSLSRRFAENAGANADLYNLLAAQTRATRMWVHYTELLIFDVWFTLFYGILLRFSLVPRWISCVGLLAVSHLLVGGWLIAKGFSGARSVGDA